MKKISIAILFIFIFVFPILVLADDYRWIKSPYPDGDMQLIPVDPKICKVYEENLRYFAKRNVPMSCRRPIAPHLKDRIKEVEWEDINPDQYPDLFRAIVTYNKHLPKTSEDIILRDIKFIRSEVENKVRVFRRAKLQLTGRINVQAYSAEPEPYWIIQYGVNDISSNNLDKISKCKICRGGGIESDLNLYIVSETKKELTKGLPKLNHYTNEGQNLITIDGRLFVENIHPKAWIELNEVGTELADSCTVCIFKFKKTE
jgi:hypothetical protein